MTPRTFPQQNSLILRFGLALGGIILLTFFSLISSIFISESISGMGSAINQAGSLRMISFQVATELISSQPDQENSDLFIYLAEFEKRLYHHNLTRAIPFDTESPIYQSHYQVVNSWKRRVKPLFQALQNPPLAADTDSSEPTPADKLKFTQSQYLVIVDHFVALIDDMVAKLEEETEHKIKILHIIETTSLFLAIAIVMFAITFIQSSILLPLQVLMNATEKIRQGDFNYRATIYGNNELSELANTFNAMISELSDTYASQEREIMTKTDDLRQKKQAMELLYHTTEILSSAPTDSKSYQQILDGIHQQLNIESGLICLSQPDSPSGHVLASNFDYNKCKRDCNHCHSNCETVNDELVFPIQDNQRSFGLLLLKLPDNKKLDHWQTSTIKMISEQIGSALTTARGTIMEREHALSNERSKFARELHDSMAQSLSYLKIEVSRLQTHLNSVANIEPAQQIISDIRSELTNAYQQLRELITTFRLSPDDCDLEKSTLQILEEFRARSGTKVIHDIRLGDCRATPNESRHLAYILREALNNIQKHALANQAWVEIRCTPSRQLHLTIQDDGVGYDPNADHAGHYGLSIMKERCEAIQGQFNTKTRLGGGTTIEVYFTPAQHQTSHSEGTIATWISNI